MDENNQVLDVTYGNFSCRLEGFDDSVETMKVVVSFFHDLAGHDRFMDTAPLAPDMETLARLTEEQTGQPVDVEGYDNKVSLRARTEAAADDVISEDDAEEIVDDPVVDAVEDIEALDDEAGDVAEDMSSVADKLQRMRAAAARKVPSVSDEYAEDLTEAAPAAAVNPLSQRLNELVQRTTQADEVDETEDDLAATDFAEGDVVTDDAEDDTDQAEMAADAAEEVEAADADDEDITVATDEMDDAAEAEVTPTEDAVEEEAEATEEQEVAEADLTEDAADGDAFDADDMNVFTEIAQEQEVAEDAAPVDAFILDDPIVPAAGADDEEPVSADMSEEETTDEDAELDAFLAEEDTAEDDTVSEADNDEIADTAPVSTPLVLTPADEAVDAPEPEHDDYNDDDEFDLEAEVAKVEAEIAARRGNTFAERGLPRHVEDAMSRIMSQTDQHLNQPENRRHRDAFAQLKAAVAATEAARQLGDQGADKRDPDEVYKDDLGAHGDHEKGERALSTPLKLVKSQEVQPEEPTVDEDTPQAEAPATPEPTEVETGTSARLRKIATLKETEVSDSGDDFAAFLASHGVDDLTDQLEAAAAYICFVEGDADFSRPQVMKMVQSASDAEISREDGLRSFGRLLRQARLVKLASGRFQVSENTQFRPDDSQAAQG
ncbi:hypothetical protein [Yoonia maricola]|nr:hypothetical protein [Yoonia maricola]